MENMHYVYIKGHEVLHGFIGSCVNNKEWFECLTIVHDYQYESLKKDTCDMHIGGSNHPIVRNGDYSLRNNHIVDLQWRDMTQEEKKNYNKVLKNNNLCFKLHITKGISLMSKVPYTTKSIVLCWEDTNKMPISVNGNTVTYDKFMSMSFNDNIKIVNSWDNGYSYCGEKTNKLGSVYHLLDIICSEHDENCNNTFETTFKGGKVHYGELFTWQFDKKGVLQLRLTEKDINWSQISNT